MRNFMRRYIGDKDFYVMVLRVTIPIMIQQAITNFVSLLDNIMVGQIGTAQMSGVAIANQLIFVFNICVFGAVSGAGIFGAQFYGKGDHEGLRDTFRFKVLVCLVLSLIATALFWTQSDLLINLYLKGEADVTDVAEVLRSGKEYLWIMIPGIIPFAWTQCYASTLKETGETVLPMKAGVTAVAVNLIFNYILIFGKFGAPVLGASGAAIATVISRYVELIIVMVWTHRHKERNKWQHQVYRTLLVRGELAKSIFITGTPLLVNESLWAAGMALLTQTYSLRGISVIAAMNISSTISNVFNVVFFAIGNAVAIVVGQLLGAGKMEQAKDTDRKLLFFSVMSCFFIGAIMFLMAPLFPDIYNTEQIVKDYAAAFLRTAAICMPLNAFTHASYFTLRSGGKTMITFLFDSVFVWVVNIPLAYLLCVHTTLPIVPLYFVCCMTEALKCIIGYILVKKGVWLHNIVSK